MGVLQVRHDPIIYPQPQPGRDFIAIIAVIRLLSPSTPRGAKLVGCDTSRPRHIRQSSGRHGDTARGLMQISSEVAFSADTPLSLRTRIRTLAQGSLIYRFTNTCCHLFTAALECRLPIPEFERLGPGSAGRREGTRLTPDNRQINRSYPSS